MDDPFKGLLADLPLRRVGRQEDHTHTVFAGCRQGEAQIGANVHEEPVGQLEEQAGAVAGVWLRAAGAAMAEVEQDGQGLADDLVGLLALDVDYEAYAAGVVLEAGVVKALLGRQSGVVERIAHDETAPSGIVQGIKKSLPAYSDVAPHCARNVASLP